MPTSNYHQLNELTALIALTNPGRMLDVGIGFGKYGFLAREYLELWDGRQVYADWRHRIDGVEAYEDYISPLQRYVYDHIYVGDARKIVPALDIEYDLAIIIGTLEHFTYEDGMSLLEECLQRCCNVLISTPLEVGFQEERYGNPYEAHVFQWRIRHFRSLGTPFFTVRNADSLIVYIGKDAMNVQRLYRRQTRRKTIKSLLPWLRIPLRVLSAWHQRLRRSSRSKDWIPTVLGD